MIFKSLCRDAEIGANSYLLQGERSRVVLDAGMHPKAEGAEAIPHFEWLEDDTVDGVVISHSHLDHVGTLPVLMERQNRARIYCTEPTSHLVEAMLHNSVNVMQSKRSELGIVEYPFFGHRDIDAVRDLMMCPHLERRFELDPDGEMQATFYDAGHILGSVGVKVECGGKTLMYTGDINFEPTTLQCGAQFPEESVDALVVETTRGDSERKPDYSREDEENHFAECMQGVLQRKGSVLVPVFAMGKTQEVLAMIHRFKEEDRVPYDTPVYIGGLSTKMTFIYDRFCDTPRRQLQGFRFFKDMEIEGGGRRRKGPIPFHPGCIYALSSGMMTEKTVSHQFARQGLLENKKHGLFFVGYCDPATPGARIKAAKQGDMVSLGEGEPEVKLRCETREFDFSGHSTREAILDYILKVKPKKCLLVHGDKPALEWFRAKVSEALPETEVLIPEPGQEVRI
ncbi:MAG: MBL fold metallo-hydrolase [Akkermansiaceae bacterium]|nr:MBL fold metallo-hydrolase [Akkermansiaceae bacterium]